MTLLVFSAKSSADNFLYAKKSQPDGLASFVGREWRKWWVFRKTSAANTVRLWYTNVILRRSYFGDDSRFGSDYSKIRKTVEVEKDGE